MPVFKCLEPMRVHEASRLLAHGRIPRSDEVADELVDLDALDPPRGAEDLVVFVSHRWLRPRQMMPDTADHAKFDRVRVGLEILKRQFATPPRRIFVWIDYSCIDQDDDGRKLRGVRSLPAYVERSDALLTPILANSVYTASERRELQGWDPSVLHKVTQSMFSLDREILVKYLHSTDLFRRGWIRVEEVLGSNAPMPEKGFDWFRKKGVPHRQDRPHFFVTPEMLPENFLLLLPRLQNATLASLRPEEGLLTSEADREAIRDLLNTVDLDDSEPTSLEGPRDDDGRLHGDGAVEVCFDGERYEGSFVHGARHGPAGKLFFPTGDWYEGDFQDGFPHGKGIYHFADGDWYEGDFERGEHCGQGTMHYSFGDTHSGQWRADSEEGPGVTTFPNGDVYEGEYHEGNRHGRGVYRLGSPSTFSSFEGHWKDRKKHGRGIWTLTNGTTVRVVYRADRPQFWASLWAGTGVPASRFRALFSDLCKVQTI